MAQPSVDSSAGQPVIDLEGADVHTTGLVTGPRVSGPHASGPRGNLALYRRYRSATFAEIIGQEHVTEPLSVALKAGRVNHAYLFSGPRGCGKTSSARILARSLNCEQGPTPTPCGVCNSCRELAPNGPGSIDVIEIDAASHNGVDDARDLRERAYYSPARDRFKVYIIDEAHMVTSHAFNALLKVVEEPPDHIVFIFATTEPEKVLQTIRSRTHHYPFRLVAPSVLRGHLEQIAAAEGVPVEPAVYPLVVRAGAGSVRDALSLLDQLFAGADVNGVTYQSAVALLGVTDAALIDDMIDALAVGDGASVYATVDRVIEAGHEPRRFATDLLDRLRDLLILDAVPDAAEKGLLDAPADALERMRDQATRIGSSAAARYAETVHAALIEMRGTTAPRLLLELVCARMLLPDASSDSAALLQRLERIERLQRMQVVGPSAVASSVDVTSASSVVETLGAAEPTERGQRPQRPEPAASRHGGSGETSVPGPVAAQAPSARPRSAADTSASASAAADATAATGANTATNSPAAATSGGLDVTQVRALWPEVLDAVRQSSRRTRALLDSAQVAGIDGYDLHLVMATAPLVRILGEASNLEVVTSALAGLLPGRWTVHVEVGTDINATPVLPVLPVLPSEPSAAPHVTGPGTDSAAAAGTAATATATSNEAVTWSTAPPTAGPGPGPGEEGLEPATTADPVSPSDASTGSGWPAMAVIPSSEPAAATSVAAPRPIPSAAKVADQRGRNQKPETQQTPTQQTPTQQNRTDQAQRTQPSSAEQPSTQESTRKGNPAPNTAGQGTAGPGAARRATGRTAAARTAAAAGSVRGRPSRQVAPADPEPLDEPPDDDYDVESDAPVVRHDPEAQALDLLRQGLGAQPLEG